MKHRLIRYIAETVIWLSALALVCTKFPLIQVNTVVKATLPAILMICLFSLGAIICKGLRLYFILLGRWHGFESFVNTYNQITLINLIYPFKLGEIYRIYKIGKKIGSYSLGFVTVLVDRFFDTVPLVFLFLLAEQKNEIVSYTVPGVVITVFVLLFLAYLVYPSFYFCLNRYLMLAPPSEIKLRTLKILEDVRSWYLYTKSMVHGKSGILLFFSAIGWIFEYLAIFSISSLSGTAIEMGGFVKYLTSVFVGSENAFTKAYLFFSITVFAIVFVVMGILASRRKIHEKYNTDL